MYSLTTTGILFSILMITLEPGLGNEFLNDSDNETITLSVMVLIPSSLVYTSLHVLALSSESITSAILSIETLASALRLKTLVAIALPKEEGFGALTDFIRKLFNFAGVSFLLNSWQHNQPEIQ